MVVTWCCLAIADEAPRPRVVDIAGLVRALGSEDFHEREEATKRLMALAVDEPPAELIAALKSPYPEVRERATKAVQAIRTRDVVNGLPRGEGFAKRGEIDLFVAATAKWDLRADDARLWEPALQVGRTVIKKAEHTEDRLPHGCPATFQDFATYKKLFNPRLIRIDTVHARAAKDARGRLVIAIPEAIQSAGINAPFGLTALAISRGEVRAETAISSSLVLANGNVFAGDDAVSSIIICDGDVSISTNVSTCLIFARGNITIGGNASGSTFVAGGDVTIRKPFEEPPILKNLVREKDSNPLGFITFFELHRVGLDVKGAKGEVQIAKVTPKSGCEKAGVKVGDVVLDVGGKKPTDAESLRRLLRDALAIGDATVKLQRGNETISVKVSLP